jgi:LDH2 family malate/lactate/ureidoglycolate dehydrogenase
MNAPAAASARVPAPAIRAFIRDALVAVHIPPEDAARIAELMTEADLTGADAHGVFRLPQYVKRVEAGGLNRRPNITVERTAAATAVVDGDNGFGHLVMSRAAATAVEMAREAGIGWAGVRRSNHAGPAGLYAEMPVRHGMIGIYSAVASANHMAVWGGAETLLGTNPIAVGLPAGEGPPVVFDMATTVVSYGTVKNYALQGREMPEGWFVNRHDGTPLTDPRRSADGLLLPIGGYKGSGLALILGLLAGPLNGAAFGRDVIDFNADATSETNTGHFIVALDIARFVPMPAFTAEVDRHLRDLRNSPRLPAVDAIRLPGDRRAQCRAERTRDGVPMARALADQLDRLAHELRLQPLASRKA